MNGPGRSVQIREARPDEHQPLGELTVAAYTALLGEHMTDQYEAELRDVAGRAATGAILVAVAPDGSLLGGVTYLTGAPEFGGGSPDEVSLRMLAVAAEAQGRGVGTALLQACIDRARAEGRPRILLHTTQWMATAIHIYERLGFRRARRRDASVPEVRLMAYVLDLRQRPD